MLVYRLAYNGDVVRRSPDQSAVFQGGPSRTGGKAPISGFIRVESGSRRTEKRFQSSIGFQPVEIHAGCVCYLADGPF